MLNRREWLAAAVAAFFANGASASPVRRPTIRVRKQPGCGCCDKWADHLEENGFTVAVEEDPQLDAYRNRLGIPSRLWSCHTGVIDGYAVEGHVPADLIQRMIEQKPAIVGIAVPGMPMGSPGMEGPVKQVYDVIAFRKDATTFLYARR